MVNIIKRSFWIKKIDNAWKEKNIIWLHGVRRVGKTFLCRSLKNVEYFDCELPRTRRIFDDPEEFLDKYNQKRIAIDEIHRLANPTEILKIAADYHKETKIIATGSSTLGSSKKFKDSLTQRKKDIWLLPLNWQDLLDFNDKQFNIVSRLEKGGLPLFFLSERTPSREFQEWLDDFWAKDIIQLFRLEKHYSFQKFIELILTQSGGIFEANKFSRPCEASRTTINNYLKILEATGVAYVVRPFSSYKPTEIVAAPKVYGFDTGFISYFKGFSELRIEDLGFLWEHFVLNELYSRLQTKKIHYWRNKAGHEVDFVIIRNNYPFAIETKWRGENFNPGNIISFRHRYPEGKNFVVAHNIDREFNRNYRGIKVEFVSLPGLVNKLE